MPALLHNIPTIFSGRIGIVAALAYTVLCVVVSLAIGGLAVLSTPGLWGPQTEDYLLAGSALVSLMGLSLDYRNRHYHRRCIADCIVGLGLLFVARGLLVGSDSGLAVATAGAVFVVTAYLISFKLYKHCPSCQDS